MQVFIKAFSNIKNLFTKKRGGLLQFKIEKLAFVINTALPILAFVSLGLSGLFSPSSILLFSLLSLNIYCRHYQKKHSLLANFGLLALFRYFFESVGPEFRQYLYSSDTEERPFNRVERRDVYIKAKNKDKASAFGSLMNFDGREYKLKHSFYPEMRDSIQPFRLTFGEERGLKNLYSIDKPLLIGGMSYGSLGKQAVRALARGAKKARIPMNTGEGGWPKYHLMEACDLIFQMGTGKFGVRKENGDLDPEKLQKLCQKPEIKMVEIKFSQGGKPGKGGLLPKEKITEEISSLRNIPMGEDLFSPPRHKECVSPLSTVRFIRRVQEITELPVGIKFCLGRENEIHELFSLMKRENLFPDYIAIDGSEGGTGAAPKTFMDDLGWPLNPALKIVQQTMRELSIENKFKTLCSGKLIGSGRQMMALALGADAVYTARGFLLALGCIQALRCHTNSCPTGITTHNPRLMKGLNIEEKSERVKNYAENLIKYNYELLGALGLKKFSDLQPQDLIHPV